MGDSADYEPHKLVALFEDEVVQLIPKMASQISEQRVDAIRRE